MDENMPEYLVIDLETSIKNQGDEAVGDFKASPYNPHNDIVMLGAVHEDMEGRSVAVWSNRDDAEERGVNHMRNLPSPYKDTIVVGHNISFDLGYLLRDFEHWREWADNGGIIWDTMLVDYILSGQVNKFSSLDELAIEAGGTIKDDKISQYWQENVMTEDIPFDELLDYQISDVKNTELVFLKQIDAVYERKMMPLVGAMMEARMATIEMERNGMFIDEDILNDQQVELQKEINAVENRIHNTITLRLPKETWSSVNVNSPKTIGMILFGGKYPYVIDEEVVDPIKGLMRIKSGPRKGAIKTKKAARIAEVTGMFNGTDYSSKGVTGAWATGDTILRNILDRETKYDGRIQFVENVLKLRGLKKDMSAYYEGYKKLLWHDCVLHPQYNHCATDTGRLSCSKPNLQQASGKSN